MLDQIKRVVRPVFRHHFCLIFMNQRPVGDYLSFSFTVIESLFSLY
jgi:hypothetical protein